MKKSKFTLIFLIFPLLIGGIDTSNNEERTIQIIKELEHKRELEKRSEFSIENLRWQAERFKIKFVDIFIAQCKHETGNFTSKLFWKNNNLTGMKLPSSRKTTATGEQSGHAFYESWVQCVEDYALWQQEFKSYISSCSSEDDYQKVLEHVGYAVDSKYNQKLNNYV